MDAIDKINFYLSKKGKNGADLSRALGLSNSIYSQWNTRKTKPSNVRLPVIAEYLGVSVEDIMPDDVAAPAASEDAKKAPDPEIEGVMEDEDLKEAVELLKKWIRKPCGFLSKPPAGLWRINYEYFVG